MLGIMHYTTFLEAYPSARRAAEARSIATASAIGPMICESEDVEQEAMVDLWRVLPCCDPYRSSLRPFVERVMASRVTSVLQFRHATQREPVFFDSPAVVEYERWMSGSTLRGYSQCFRIVIDALLSVDGSHAGLCGFVAGR